MGFCKSDRVVRLNAKGKVFLGYEKINGKLTRFPLIYVISAIEEGCIRLYNISTIFDSSTHIAIFSSYLKPDERVWWNNKIQKASEFAKSLTNEPYANLFIEKYGV